MQGEDIAESRRIVRMDDFAWTGQVQVVEAGQPEAQCARAQHDGPGGSFGRGEWSHTLVGCQQGLRARRIDAAISGYAPVVDHHRQIKQPDVAAGEVKVDHAADGVSVEQDVVAEQVGVDDAAG